MYCKLRQWICLELEMGGICLIGDYGRSAWGLDKSLFDPPFKSYARGAMELTLRRCVFNKQENALNSCCYFCSDKYVILNKRSWDVFDRMSASD